MDVAHHPFFTRNSLHSSPRNSFRLRGDVSDWSEGRSRGLSQHASSKLGGVVPLQQCCTDRALRCDGDHRRSATCSCILTFSQPCKQSLRMIFFSVKSLSRGEKSRQFAAGGPSIACCFTRSVELYNFGSY